MVKIRSIKRRYEDTYDYEKNFVAWIKGEMPDAPWNNESEEELKARREAIIDARWKARQSIPKKLPWDNEEEDSAIEQAQAEAEAEVIRNWVWDDIQPKKKKNIPDGLPW